MFKEKHLQGILEAGGVREERSRESDISQFTAGYPPNPTVCYEE